MPTKTQTIDELTAEVAAAEAALGHAHADVAELQQQLDALAAERSSVSVRELGSKTEAVKALGKLDRKETDARRGLSLARVAVEELTEDLEAAKERLETARQAEREEALTERYLERNAAGIAVEEAIETLREAARAYEAASGRVESAQRAAGYPPPSSSLTSPRERLKERLWRTLGGPDGYLPAPLAGVHLNSPYVGTEPLGKEGGER